MATTKMRTVAVGQFLTVEGLTNGANFVITCDKKMKKSNDSTLELSSTSSVDGSWTEGFPHDVRSNEKTKKAVQ